MFNFQNGHYYGDGWGQVKIYPYKKGEGVQSLSHADWEGGGGTNSFKVVLIWGTSVLASSKDSTSSRNKNWFMNFNGSRQSD